MTSLDCSNLNTTKLTHAKVFIFANGCHENHMDAELLKNYLTNKFEVRVVDKYQDADLVLIQGCSVTEHMENESKQFINFMKEKKENESIVVLGCLSKFRPETIIDESKNLIPLDEIEQNLYRMGDLANKYTANTLYATPSQTIQFVEEQKENAIRGYFGYEKNLAVIGFMQSRLYNFLLFFKKSFEKRIDLYNQNTFCIKVSTGCTGKCTYCSIRIGRGKIKSKTIDDILGEFNKGIELGYKHIGLMGTDIGDYGKDINSDLYERGRRVVDSKG